MANNRIQIKRSVANATVTGLSNGELAFTQASNTLHIGLPDGSGVLRIGGAQYPGILTNSHALVANATGEIDKVIVANAVVTSLVANGSPGSNGQVLVTNGSAIYWGTGTSGQNTYVQFNDSGVANGVAGFAFTKTSNTLFVGNTLVVTNINVSSINASSYLVGNVTTGSGGFFANSTEIIVGNNTVNAYINSTSFNTGYPGSGTGGFVANATTVTVGNTSVNTIVDSGQVNIQGQTVANTSGVWTTAVLNINNVTIANTTGVFTTDVVNAASHTVGSNFIANSSGVYHTGAVNAISFNAGNTTTGTGGIHSNSTVIVIGNNTVNTFITSAGLNVNNVTVANSSGVFAVGTVNAFSHTVGTNTIANSSGVFAVGTVNASLVSIGTDFTANSSKVVFTGANVDATSATAEFLNVIVTGNTSLGNATSDHINVLARVTGNVNPSANVNYDLGSNNLRWREVHTQNLHSTVGYFDGSVEIGGDIIVTGNLVTTNVSSVIVSDPMIYLAGNNYTSDLLDIGFAANYHDISTNKDLHTGLFRDASDGGIYKLYTGSEQELSGNNVVNTAANGFSLAILQTFLQSGAIVSNNTTLTITANSTCNVNITANTLLLSTALAGTEGGTGYKTTINQAILVGNSSNGYDRLSLGTSGYVLQSNGTHLVYDYLDGGSF